MSSTIADRLRQVVQMRANFALEGFEPDATDLFLQSCYVLGHVTVNDMLTYARAYAAGVQGSQLPPEQL